MHGHDSTEGEAVKISALLLPGVLAALVAAPSAFAVPPTSVFDGDVDCGTVTDVGTGADAVPGSLG